MQIAPPIWKYFRQSGNLVCPGVAMRPISDYIRSMTNAATLTGDETMTETQEIQGLAAEMKKSRDNWTITWEDGDTVNYYGDDPDKYARSTKEFAWGMTYTVRKN